MKNKILKFIIVTYFCALNCSCWYLIKTEPHIKIKNNSGKAIYIGVSYSYPDTGINKIDFVPYINGNKTQKINAYDSVYKGSSFLDMSPTIEMFFFDADVVEKNPWDSIVAHNWVLKRYQFTKDDVEKWHWTITYP